MKRAAQALAPLVAMTIEAFMPIVYELCNLPHVLARNWRIYRAKRRGFDGRL